MRGKRVVGVGTGGCLPNAGGRGLEEPTVERKRIRDRRRRDRKAVRPMAQIPWIGRVGSRRRAPFEPLESRSKQMRKPRQYHRQLRIGSILRGTKCPSRDRRRWREVPVRPTTALGGNGWHRLLRPALERGRPRREGGRTRDGSRLPGSEECRARHGLVLVCPP